MLFLAQEGEFNLWVTRTALTYEDVPPPLASPISNFAETRNGPIEVAHARLARKGLGASSKGVGHLYSPGPSKFLTVRFEGASGHSTGEGLLPTGARTNYFVGGGRTESGLDNFRSAMVKGLYPGIDLIVTFMGESGRPNYDFVVHPGASPSAIRMKLEGANHLRIQGATTLRYDAPYGPVTEGDLDAFATTTVRRAVTLAASPTGRRVTPSAGLRRLPRVAWRKNGRDTVGFCASTVRANETLLIDPQLSWGVFWAGAGETVVGHDAAANSAVCPDGSIVMVGGTLAPTLPGSTVPHSTFWNMWASKVTPTGTIEWTTYLGGHYGDCWANGVAVGSTGTIVLAGFGGSSDLPLAAVHYNNNGDGAIAWIDPTSRLLGTMSYGGEFYDEIRSVAIPPGGDASSIAITGYTESYYGGGPNVLGIPNAQNSFITPGGFVAFTTNTPNFETGLESGYSYYVTAQQPDAFPSTYGIVTPNGIKMTDDHTAVIWGYTDTHSLPAKMNNAFGVFEDYDGFVGKVSVPGYGGINWTRYVGGPYFDDLVNGVIGADGSIYGVGYSYSNIAGAINSNAGNGDIMVTKVSGDGTSTDWVRLLGTSQFDVGIGMAMAEDGSLLVVGGTGSYPAFALTGGGYAFVTSLSADGKTVNWTKNIGGGNNSWAADIALDSDGSIIVSGDTYSTRITGFTGSTPGKTLSGFACKVVGTPLSLTMTPSAPKNGTSTTGTFTLDWSVPIGSQAVALSSSSPDAQVPATVSVAAGSSSVTFPVTTSEVAADTAVTIAAKANGVSKSTTLTLKGPRPSSVKESSSSVSGGATVTVTISLDSPAPPQGLTLSLAQTGLSDQDIPRTLAINAGATSGEFTLTTVAEAVSESGSISVTLNGVTKSATLKILAPTVSKLAVSPASVVGGATPTGTVTLASEAPTGGLVVALSSDSKFASVPSTVTIPKGMTSTTFQITTAPVASTGAATISAMSGSVTKSAKLTVDAPSLSTVTVAPISVVGGTVAKGTVTLGSSAPAGGLVVKLASSATYASVPTSVTIQAGQTTGTFAITTGTVKATGTATISATLGSVTRTAKLEVKS